MQKSILILLISFVLFSFVSQPQEAIPSKNSNHQASNIEKHFKKGRTNYAVVWNWTRTNAQIVSDNAPSISKELTSLWKAGVIENTYYDANPPKDKLSYFPNITFFLKANSMVDAESILNKLTIVKKGIASYRLYPVGVLWLDRKSEIINKNGVKVSFVTVWTTIDKKKISDKILKAQHEKIMTLWKTGAIENVYFDVEGTQKANNETDFVFFVNANTKIEADSICRSIPFYNEKIATYEIHQAGVFWMGKYEN